MLDRWERRDLLWEGFGAGIYAAIWERASVSRKVAGRVVMVEVRVGGRFGFNFGLGSIVWVLLIR